MQISRYPRLHLEVGCAICAIEPDGGELGHGKTETAGFGHELDAELEACIGVDADAFTNAREYALNELVASCVPTCAIRFSDTPGKTRDASLHPRATHLLTAAHVARGAGDHNAALDQARELIDLHRIVTAVGHGHDDDIRSGLRDAEAQCVRRTAPEGVEHGP